MSGSVDPVEVAVEAANERSRRRQRRAGCLRHLSRVPGQVAGYRVRSVSAVTSGKGCTENDANPSRGATLLSMSPVSRGRRSKKQKRAQKPRQRPARAAVQREDTQFADLLAAGSQPGSRPRGSARWPRCGSARWAAERPAWFGPSIGRMRSRRIASEPCLRTWTTTGCRRSLPRPPRTSCCRNGSGGTASKPRSPYLSSSARLPSRSAANWMYVDPGEIPGAADVARLGQALATRAPLYELMVNFAAPPTDSTPVRRRTSGAITRPNVRRAAPHLWVYPPGSGWRGTSPTDLVIRRLQMSSARSIKTSVPPTTALPQAREVCIDPETGANDATGVAEAAAHLLPLPLTDRANGRRGMVRAGDPSGPAGPADTDRSRTRNGPRSAGPILAAAPAGRTCGGRGLVRLGRHRPDDRLRPSSSVARRGPDWDHSAR